MCRLGSRLLASTGLLLIVAAGGCSSTDHYQLTLRPDEKGLDRELLCWRAKSSGPYEWEDFPADKLAAIAKLYGVAPAAKLDQKHSFRARFEGALPSDVGGRGSYNVWVSPFGSAASYLERFGGNDDLNAQLDARRKAANRIVDHLIAWFETELGNEPQWDELRQFLDTTVRRDVENISSILLMRLVSAGALATNGSAEPDEETAPPNDNEVWMCIWQYLIEHDYVTADDWPRLTRGLNGGDLDAPLFADLIEKRLGMTADAPRPAALAFLASNKSASVSWERYLRSTPEFQKLEQAWLEAKQTDPDATPPDPSSIAFDLFTVGFLDFKLFSDTTNLELVLALDARPVATNGRWDAQRKEVSWNTNIDETPGLPTVVYATWSWPNQPAQSACFGKLLLQGDSLYEYAIWYRALSDTELSEWDSFVATLKPGPELVPRLEEFRFSTDPPLPTGEDEPAPGSAADSARQLILNALKSDE